MFERVGGNPAYAGEGALHVTESLKQSRSLLPTEPIFVLKISEHLKRKIKGVNCANTRRGV